MTLQDKLESKLFHTSLGARSRFLPRLGLLLYRTSLAARRWREASAKNHGASGIFQELASFETYFPRLVQEVCGIVGNDQLPEIRKLLSFFLYGYRHFLMTGYTPFPAFLSMRFLYCLTDGLFNRLMKDFLASLYPPCPFPSPGGILGEPDDRALQEILEGLNKDGYYVFKHHLSEDLCERLLSFALNTECAITSGEKSKAVYDPAKPLSVMYTIPHEAMAENPDIRALILDTSVLAAAQSFLGCLPVLIGPDLWWSTSRLKEPSSAAAQLYHVDSDRLSFINFFVYLTDVGPKNGPHSYVRGSHAEKPPLFRQDRRFSDLEVERHYGRERMVEITGPRGTMFFVNTRGFHKGKHLSSGHRLVFQMVYAASPFGAPLEPFSVADPEFLAALRRYPRTYSNFVTCPS